jgi:transketolase
MRKQLVKTVGDILDLNIKTTLLLGDIGVFGFRKSFESHPDRVFNIGILEQSTISLASGMSSIGLIPIVHTIAPFLVERSLEQLKIDFGYQSLNGNFITIGNSYDYSALGPTHHCPGDVQQLLTIPNMEIIVPGCSHEFDLLFKETYNNGNPTYFRLSEYENDIKYDVKFGKALKIKDGSKATVICIGNLLQTVLEVCQDLDVTLLYYTTINPFDFDTLIENFNEKIIVFEPYYEGALNYKISKSLNNKKYNITNVGVPHVFLTNYGTKKEHDRNLGLDKIGIKKIFEECL